MAHWISGISSFRYFNFKVVVLKFSRLWITLLGKQPQ
jgi:hypothetical protein